jgi:hypothetical protein
VGSVVQHAAECLSGIVIHQLAQPAAPVVWGGAPSIFYPGTNDWELVAAQTELFSLVDAAPFGVRLMASFLMTPCKSVSMVIGPGKKMRAAMAEPCDECGASSTCRHRLTNP